MPTVSTVSTNPLEGQEEDFNEVLGRAPMKAARVHAYGGPEQLIYEDAPTPSPGAGEVLVKVEACGVNPLDVWFRSGHLSARFARPLPFIPGWEIAGTVCATGPGVTDLKVGQAVFGLLDVTADGGYAEYTVVECGRLRPTPPGLDSVQAAALPLAGLTGVQMVENSLDVLRGERLLVTGALGPVGRSAVYAARLRGAEIVAGVRRERLQEAESVFGVECIAIDEPDTVARFASSFDAVVDTIGPAALAPLYDTVRPGGRIVTVVPLPPADIGSRSLSMTHMAVKLDPDRTITLAEDVIGGRLALAPVQHMPLSEAAQAHVQIQGRGGKKIVLCP